ncbi:site-specific DNA-methyltransferase [Treponema phagedenis]|uniref:site-specific DNA-methyltransferase n=1 Tax=Treponema phagedenis TaxID=162 RepID=UPI0004679682|nr:site-specific DNA-methyltransferase [Treponema phagedenis]
MDKVEMGKSEMEKSKTGKLKMRTENIADANFAALSHMFPNAVTETIDENGEKIRAIDADKLAQEINTRVISGMEERYQFTWPDKRKSVVLANMPIAAALRPCREESVDFDNTENLYIEGDNLDVLKLLRETYLNKVKMIYIDPPYNTGKNYIYTNDYSQTTEEYLMNSGQYDYDGNRLVQNTENNGRFHTDWLNMIYPRLKIAKQLLTSDGVLVVAIDENEFSSLSLLLKEIFGETGYEHSYVSVVHNPRGQQGINFSYVNEYLIFIYPSDGKKYISNFPKEKIDSRSLRDSGTESDRADAKSCFYPFYVKGNKIVRIGDVASDNFHPKSANIRQDDGTIEIWPMTDNGDEKKWRYARQSVEQIIDKLEPKHGRNSIQIIFHKDEGTMRSVWKDPRYDSSEYGTKVLDALFGGAPFTFPKSLYAVYDCIKAATKNDTDAIVMDFFSGSATTAHAVMQLNSEDGGRRKYIMVQIPDNLDDSLVMAPDRKIKQQIQKTIGFLDSIDKSHTICEIGKERIRRAAEKIRTENPDAKFDGGFRVLKLDSSNMKEVYYTPDEYTQQDFYLDGLTDNIKEDRSDEDLLFQVMLDLGIPLSAKITRDNNLLCVNDNYLIACFERVDIALITKIAKRKPHYAVFRDGSFTNDAVLSNFEQVFKTHSPNTIRRIL